MAPATDTPAPDRESFGFYPVDYNPANDGKNIYQGDAVDYAGLGYTTDLFQILEAQAQSFREYVAADEAGVAYNLFPGVSGPETLQNCASFATTGLSRAGVSTSIPLRSAFPWWAPSRFPSSSDERYEDIDPRTNTGFMDAVAFTPRIDPLVLDLDGDDLELTAATGEVLFDHNADGIRTGTGWVASDDALLAWDRNSNGLIDSGRELFGVDMIKANGQFASDGFDALRDLDANGDGAFTSADTAYSQVRLWRDLDQDGVTDAGELASLAASNIARISLASTASGALINNRIDSTSTVTRSNGSTTLAETVGVAFSAATTRDAVNCGSWRRVA